jgi:glycosyltransferase involved in cell wall biosynthesis
VEVSVVPLFSDAYLQTLYQGGLSWREVLTGYGRRLLVLLRVRHFDVVIIEKELFPYLPAVVERLLGAMSVPYVADYDDALFHRYDRHPSGLVRGMLGRKIDAVMRHSAVVVAGNEYLAERARQAGASRVEVIPTVVDTARYLPRQGSAKDIPVVGWIGTPNTSRYLLPLLPVFEALRREMSVRFVAVGAREVDFDGTPVEALAWSEDTEVASIQHFDIGIMPLEDSPWERGKCGYKLIQYMACGLPVVASPVGVNLEIVVPEENGLLADTPDEWKRVIRRLLQGGASVRESMGRFGRNRIEGWYSLQTQAPRFLETVRKAVR